MIKVLIVDDSPVVRKTYRRILRSELDVEVVGEAGDPFQARDLVLSMAPDVVLLDIEMPRMDGLTFLRRLMAHHPVAVLICSSLTGRGSQKALEAMDGGAVDVICKPNQRYSLANMAEDLVKAVRVAASAIPRPPLSLRGSIRPMTSAVDSRAIVAVGASTGGTVAIEDLLSAMPPDAPPLVITQHMPAYMTAVFAERVNRVSAIEVREARDGDTLQPGRAFIAPGGHHLTVEHAKGGPCVRVSLGPAVNGHRPSVDVLFHSVAQTAQHDAVGILLTGMGRDGAEGLLAMRRAGAFTMAQDAASCVVFGMPKAAIEIDAVDEICALRMLPERLFYALSVRKNTRAMRKTTPVRASGQAPSHSRTHGPPHEVGNHDLDERETR